MGLTVNKSIQGMPKGKKKQTEKTKQSSEPDSDMSQMFELKDREFKIYVRDSNGKSRQHARTDG